MRTRVAVILMILVSAGFRVWWMGRPIGIPEGTKIKLNVEVGKVHWDKAERWFMYKELVVPIPVKHRFESGTRVRVIGVVEKQVGQQDGLKYFLKVSDFDVVRNESSLWSFAQSANLKLRDMILSWLPGDAGALAAGILLGGNVGMSDDGLSAFKRSGASHITAASGYNVSVTAGVVMFGLAKKFGRRKAIPFGIVCIVLYVMLAGGTGAVVRAGVMVGLTLVGKYLGRPIEAWWMLLLSGWGMVMVRPEWAFDIGFQLSLAATAGIMMTGGSPGEPGWRSDLRMSFAASLMTIPVILYYFGDISVWSPVVNVLVLWCVPWIMEIIMAAVVIGLVFDPLGQLIAYLAWPLTTWMTSVVNQSQYWVGNGWNVGTVEWWWVIVYYLVVVCFWWHVRRRMKQ